MFIILSTSWVSQIWPCVCWRSPSSVAPISPNLCHNTSPNTFRTCLFALRHFLARANFANKDSTKQCPNLAEHSCQHSQATFYLNIVFKTESRFFFRNLVIKPNHTTYSHFILEFVVGFGQQNQRFDVLFWFHEQFSFFMQNHGRRQTSRIFFGYFNQFAVLISQVELILIYLIQIINNKKKLGF